MISALYFSPMPEKNFTASSRHHAPMHRQIPFRNLVHALLDRGEIVGREGPLGEVVVEAVLDHRSDGDLRVREKLLHRLRQEVRGRVAQDVDAFGIALGDDLHLRVALSTR